MDTKTKEIYNKILQNHPKILSVEQIGETQLFILRDFENFVRIYDLHSKSYSDCIDGLFEKYEQIGEIIIFYYDNSSFVRYYIKSNSFQSFDFFSHTISPILTIITYSSDLSEIINHANNKKTPMLYLSAAKVLEAGVRLTSLKGTVAILNPDTMEISSWQYE